MPNVGDGYTVVSGAGTGGSLGAFRLYKDGADYAAATVGHSTWPAAGTFFLRQFDSTGNVHADSGSVVVTAIALTAPVLSNLSTGWTSGENPPAWDTYLPDGGIYYDASDGTGDQFRLVWRFGGTGSFTTTGWQPYDINFYVDGFTFPFLTDGTLNAGGLFEVYVEQGRDIGLPGQKLSGNSNKWQDTLSAVSPINVGVEVQEGDSVTAWGGGYADRYAALYPSLTYHKTAVGGSGQNDVLTRLPSDRAYKPEVYSIFIGENDLSGGTYSSGSNYFSILNTNIIQPLLSDGTKVVVATAFYQDSSIGNYATNNTRVPQFNAALKAAVGGNLFCCDWENSPMGTLAAASDTTKFISGSMQHPTDGTTLPTSDGHALMLPNYKGAMNAARGVANSVAQFTFTDVPSATASTLYTSNDVLIQGLNYLETKSYLITAGFEVRKTTAAGVVGSWVSNGTGTVANGDSLAVRATASATPSTSVSVVLTVGSVTDTYTVTTASMSSLTTTFRSAATHNDGFGAASPFTGLTTYTGLKHSVCIESSNGGAAPSALTLDGVSMTKRAEVVTGSNAISFWDCVITTGGTGKTLAITQGSAFAIGYGMWTTDGTATYVASVNKASSAPNDPQVASSSLTIPSGGSALVGVMGFGGGPITANSGTAQDAQVPEATSGDICWFGHLTATGAPSVSGLAFQGSQILAVSYQP